MAASSPGLRKLLRASTLYLGLLGMFAAGHLVSPQFLTLDNQRDVLWQVSGIGTIAIGMTLVILTAGIDLSVGSMLSLCSVVCAMLLTERGWTRATTLAAPSFALTCGLIAGAVVMAIRRGGRSKKGVRPDLCAAPSGPFGSTELAEVRQIGSDPFFAWAIGLAAAGLAALWAVRQVPHGFGVLGVLLVVPTVGLVLGGFCGAIIAKAKLQPFIVTLALMVSAVGLARYTAGEGGAVRTVYMSEDAAPGTAPASFKSLAANVGTIHMKETRRVDGKDVATVVPTKIIPVPGIFFAASAVLAWLLLNKLSIGRHIFAVGGNEEAGRLSGINTDRVKILVYGICGMLSALAAVLYCAQYEQGKADAGSGRELDAIAAVVIGGTSLMGGRGSIGGTVVGVFIFGYLSNILNLGGVSTEFQQILKGVIILLAVLLQEGILGRWISGACRRVVG